MDDVESVFVIQVITDYMDKFIAVALALVASGVRILPKSVKLSITGNKKRRHYG
ncbi:hypothetical protein [Romboutsia sp.]|uniref:hypothetical protein n=1 Tax=Romboutsia sp. TaxID=1965302 RepID=UPI002B82224C|nr:hypothetical protein [Romboutsia sp.]HSQ89335.1 hypothetical protein [Romboutsia sp.]